MSFQIGSTLLDACVLSLLMKGDTYGYVLTQEMKKVVAISESTLYPVLRRLQKNGYLMTYDQPYQGRNRRYYAITPPGREKFKEYQRDWEAYRDKVDSIILGGELDG